MDMDSIFKLIDNGFTKDEIMQLVNGNQTQVSTTTDTAEKVEEKKVEEPVVENKAAADSAVNDTSDDKYDELVGKIDELKKTFQLENIKKSEMPTQETVTFIDMMNELLR